MNLKTNPTSYKTKAFLAIKTDEELSENTIRFYESRLRLFADFCGEDFEQIDRGILHNFFSIYGKKHKSSTTNALFTAVKVFYNWYEIEASYYGKYDNPMRLVKAPRVKQIVHDPIEIEDFKKMLKYCNTFSRGALYRSLLYFMLDTGTRAQECLSTDIDDVDLITGEVIIRAGKGDKRRSVFIGKDTKKLLKTYLKTRSDNDPALWISSYGNRLTYSGLNRILKILGEKANISPPPTLHSIRRAFVKNLILDGTNPYLVQILAGWSSYDVLQKYAKLYSDDMRVAHGKSGVDKWLNR